MITDSDIKKLAKVFATKDDLKNFATKDDLKRFATKDDLEGVNKSWKEVARDIYDLIINGNGKILKRLEDISQMLQNQHDIIENHERRIFKLENYQYNHLL